MTHTKILLLTFLLSAALSALSQNYTLVWEDNFDGTTLDTSKWSNEVGGNGWGNNELQYYTDGNSNINVSGGTLKIIARQENFGGRNYTSARLATRYKGDWTYGRIEARIKTPETQGIWPAFWMSPTVRQYGVWPTSGEIDIMELLGHEPNKSYATCHYGNKWNNKGSVGGNYTLPSGDFSDGFHQFAVEWEFDEIRWYIDGNLIFTANPGNADPFLWPFDIDYYIRLNVAVGGLWPGYPDATTVFPQVMEVDYVRVYQDQSVTPEAWYNEGFESDLEDWETGTFNGASTQFQMNTQDAFAGSKSICLDVSNLGVNTYDVQLSKKYFSLIGNEAYTLKFWAKADQTGKSIATAIINASTFTPIFVQPFNLTDQWEEYTYTFVSPVNHSNLRFNFDAGFQLGTYCFDEVTLERTNTLINNGFENDYFGWFQEENSGGNANFQINTIDPYEGAKSAQIAVSSLGQNEWNIQLNKEGVDLTANKSHTLTFYAKANGNKEIGVNFLRATDFSVLHSKNFNLTNVWQPYSINFVPAESTDQVLLNMNLGFETGTFHFDAFDLIVSDTICSLPPLGLNSSFIPPNIMSLSWDADVDAIGYELRGNAVGLPGFIDINTTSNTFFVPDLVGGASYFWQVRTNCGGKYSDWSAIDTFSVPVCESPGPIFSDLVTATSVRLNWEIVENAQGYRISGRPLGSSAIVSLTVLGGSQNQKIVAGLTPQTSYEWTVQAICFGTQYSSYAGQDIFTTLPANAPKNMQEAVVEPFSAQAIDLYPNPAADQVFINYRTGGSIDHLQLIVTDLNGREINVSPEVLSDQKLKLDLSTVAPGMYFIQFRNAEGTLFIKKLIKSASVDN